MNIKYIFNRRSYKVFILYIIKINTFNQDVDGWPVTFGTARRGLGRATARPGPSSLYQM